MDGTDYQRLRKDWMSKKEAEASEDDKSESGAESDTTGLMEAIDTNALNSNLRARYLATTPQASRSPSSPGASRIGTEAGSSAPGSALGTQSPAVRSKKRSRDEVLPAPSRNDDNGLAARKDRPTTRYADLGGIEYVLQDVRELIERPLMHPEIYQWLGTPMPRGVLLHGPPGCGKTQLASAIAGELGISFLQIAAPEVVSGMSGESEAKIRQLFQDAKSRAPSLIFIDEIDVITPKRENASREMERRIVAQLLTSMDELEGDKPVMVIGATNRPDSLDPALRRAGRFDREICLNVPDKAARARILQVIAGKLRLSGDFDFDQIAADTPGYVGADLQAIAKEAASVAVNRIFGSLESFGVSPLAPTTPASVASASESINSITMQVDGHHMDTSDAVDGHVDAVEAPQVIETVNSFAHHHIDARVQVSNYLRDNPQPFTEQQLAPLSINMDDFRQAIKRVQPSAKREGFATIPNVSWEDIGALTDIRHEMEMALLEPVRSKATFDALNIPASLGVLLYGPPGCGKTLLAKAVANQAQANFISVKGPELLNKFVGESERSLRQVFQRAASSSPCIIFFDEIDALVPKRTGGENAVTERMVNSLLTELDGLEARSGISVIAATNRPDILDPAMMRPGRLDKLLYVPLPTPDERSHILRTCARKTPLSADVDLNLIAHHTKLNGFSGADLAALVREASMTALSSLLSQGDRKTVPTVCLRDFEVALTKVFPSVSKADRLRYEKLRTKLSSPHLKADKDDEATAAPVAPSAAN